MSLAITLNRAQILNEYKNLIDGDCGRWVLFSYVPSTKDELEVVSTGDDGLEEIESEFHPNKIMYALIKVEDPKTTLPKIACVNWQGEAVNGLMRGRAVNHLADFERMFRGINITIHARNEDDVDPELLLAEITRASATSYDFKNRPQSMSDNPEPIAPVGTNYTPIKPQTAIAPSDKRQQFWAKQQQDDKVRIEREKKERIEKEKRAAQELKQKELESQKRRNQEVKQRAIQIAALEKPQDIHVKMTSPNPTSPHSRTSSINSGTRTNSVHSSQAFSTFNQNTTSTSQNNNMNNNISNTSNKTTQQAPISSATLSVHSSVHSSQRLVNTSSGVQTSTTSSSSTIASAANSTMSTTDSAYSSQISGISHASNPTSHSYNYMNNNIINNYNQTHHNNNNNSSHINSIVKSPGSLHSNASSNTTISTNNTNKSVSPKGLSGSVIPIVSSHMSANPFKSTHQNVIKSVQPVQSSAASVQSGAGNPTSPKSNFSSLGNFNNMQQITVNTQERDVNNRGDLGISSGNYQSPLLKQEAAMKQNSPGLSHGTSIPSPTSVTNLSAKALYDYDADDDTEISFLPGDVITEIDQFDEGWWTGKGPDGKIGMFPANYVELV